MTVTYLEYGDIKGHGPASSETNNTEEAVTKTLLTIQTVFVKFIFVTDVQVTEMSTSLFAICSIVTFLLPQVKYPNAKALPLSLLFAVTQTHCQILTYQQQLWDPH